ncbi:MAG: transcriptional repressor [Bacteroidales bacterium]|nr:transcriptional repressor [Bacteroidales bacterium]
MDRKNISLAGMKVTPQRVAILEALQSLGHAPTDEIIRKVQELSPYISPATIYNTLEKFVQEKMISRIPTDGNKTFFDITEHPHIHLVSEDHTKMADLEDDKLQQVVEEYLAKIPIPGFKMNRVQVVLIGRFE